MSADKIKIACQRGNSGPYQKEVEGRVFGAWAAHRSTTGFDYKVTFVRFGLAVPYDFWTEAGAWGAADAINSLCADWDGKSASDIKAMAADIFEICHRESGERTNGPKMGVPCPVADLPSALAE